MATLPLCQPPQPDERRLGGAAHNAPRLVFDVSSDDGFHVQADSSTGESGAGGSMTKGRSETAHNLDKLRSKISMNNNDVAFNKYYITGLFV